ncbi:hypothetical protein [Alteriqipengyuania lutimaris]|nr:hypothetical protein [Alteriqipengyuania lutimaris]MBB3035287.1 hypothetical protein [Alteriqipengyuania lutimaris]
MEERWRERFPALFAIALPVLAGLAYMALSGAPRSYPIVNGGSLILAGAIVLAGPPRLERRARLIVGGVLLALFALPLLTGPSVNGIARWLPLGPVILHAGMLTVPALVLLAAGDDKLGPPALAAALLLALAQPDFASAFALTGGAVGMYQARRNWRIGLVIILGFLIAIAAALQGELPAVPFVERIVIDALRTSPAMAALLALSLLGSVLLMLFATGLPRAVRYPVGMSMFGFLLASLISNYPTPLAGYGAAAIIGFALAHALAFALLDAHNVDA